MMHAQRYFLTFAVLLLAGLLAGCVSPQQRMKDCNVLANDQGLKGSERQAFMSQCLKA